MNPVTTETKIGIAEILKLVDASTTLLEAGEDFLDVISKKSLGWQIRLVTLVLSAAPGLMPLAALNAEALLAEAKDLDASEKAQLVSAFKERLDLKDDALEANIESIMGLVVAGAELAAQVMSFLFPKKVTA